MIIVSRFYYTILDHPTRPVLGPFTSRKAAWDAGAASGAKRWQVVVPSRLPAHVRRWLEHYLPEALPERIREAKRCAMLRG